MKKALIATSVASMIDQFNMPNIRLLSDLGYGVTVAANFSECGSITKARAEDLVKRLEEMGVAVVNIPIPRKVSALGGILRSYRKIRKLSRENKYDIVHCHSPIGGAITRLAVRKERKNGHTKTVYTAHGFHFYNGAPKKNWMLYYPVEKLCARFTDVLLTINSEDYAFAKEKLHAGRVEYIPGVGIDNESFYRLKNQRDEKKAYFGIPNDAPVILSVGELNQNKNHETLVRAIAALENDDAHCVIAGKGELFDKLVYLSRALGIEDRVHLLGYREDVREIYGIADVFVHPSYREGLPVSVIEAMASGLPVVASNIRGNVDLIDRDGGVLLQPKDVEGFAEAIDKLIVSYKTRREMGAYNCEKAEKYSVSAVSEILKGIYTEN